MNYKKVKIEVVTKDVTNKGEIFSYKSAIFHHRRIWKRL